MKVQRQRPNIVSVHLSPEAKANLDAACEQRGMTIKSLLGRLIEWFVELDKTEQSIVLKQVEVDDVEGLAGLVLRRARDNGETNGRRTRRKRAAVAG
ncbi:MAG: hypothetical protein LC135_17160 [Phycisphaerae bacterium]|nr:hypothetical protein [Phycisphaerae bacterium]MCZ2401569.1 hypothetical protein [Phycisphaerae bacterium]NUQ12834.1 hypothetical protein [Gemmatimonadaceae bacterium]